MAIARGLEGIAITETRLSRVDGEAVCELLATSYWAGDRPKEKIVACGDH